MSELDTRVALLEQSVSQIAASAEKTANSVASMAEHVKTIVELDTIRVVMQDRIDDHEKRIRSIEQIQPITEQTNSWAGRAVVGAIGMAGGGMLTFLLQHFPGK